MRLIDADALRDDLKESYDKLWLIYQEQTTLMDREICKAELVTFNEMLLRLKDAPTIDAVPVRHGEWGETQIIGYDGIHPVYAKPCSECGHLTEMYRPRFCPACGAKMDGGAEDG